MRNNARPRPAGLPIATRDLGIPDSMISTDFEFLRPHWPELASLAGFAESYARPDPIAALVKLRSFGELLVQAIYQKLKLPRPYRAVFHDLLTNHAFEAATPRVVLAKLHAL